MGDARTGGKGSQRRKVKVVSKPTVNFDHYFREATIKLLRTSLKRWVLNNQVLMKSTSSEMITQYYTSLDHKLTLQSKIIHSSYQENQKLKPSRIFSQTSSNNWVLNNTNFSKSLSNKQQQAEANKFQILLNQI